MSSSIVTKSIHSEDQAVLKLIGHSDELLASLYPEDGSSRRLIRDLNNTGIQLIGAYQNEQLVGCGAVKFVRVSESYAEIKRLYVARERRGEGISVIIMNHLEAFIRESGIIAVKLETPSRRPDSIDLYRKLGYDHCEAFGCYRADPLSVFMQKTLH